MNIDEDNYIESTNSIKRINIIGKIHNKFNM